MSTLESLAAKFPQYNRELFPNSLRISPNDKAEDWKVLVYQATVDAESYDLSCFWGYANDLSPNPRPRAIKFENLDAKGLEKAVVYVLALKKGF